MRGSILEAEMSPWPTILWSVPMACELTDFSLFETRLNIQPSSKPARKDLIHQPFQRWGKLSLRLLLLALPASLSPPAPSVSPHPPFFLPVLRHTGSHGNAIFPVTLLTSFGWTGRYLGWTGGHLWDGSQFPHGLQYWFLPCSNNRCRASRVITSAVMC